VEGIDLFGGGAVWVALDLVLSPSREGVCVGVETNGLAAGNTLTEAVLHGLLELVERDAHAQRRFAERFADPETVAPARIVDPQTLPRSLAAVIAGLGSTVRVQDLTHDLGIPVFGVRLGDAGFPGSESTMRFFEGLGCDLDPESALLRALTEAVQSHTAVLLGARDAFEGGPQAGQAGAEGLVRRLLAREERVAFPDAAPSPPELGARLALVLERLAAAGLERCVAVDLTRPDLGIPVVRVLVPGLAGPYGDSTRRPGRRLLRSLL
jgi:YcaO-like protein with predicted kinase domain